MQLYVLDRAKNTLATTSSFYNDKHHKELTAGASIFEFTIDKSDSAAQYMTTGNYLVFKDDRGRAWSFTILSYDETQTTKTVAAEDVSIELLNKAMDVWNTNQAYPFSYYFDLVTKGTPWKLGVNQLTDLSRKLIYTGRDTGLGRLLSVLKGFDNAECQFNVVVQQNKPVTFIVDVYKSIGTVQDNIQIVYNNELADIKKTESRAQFVTALAGVGGLVENQATTDPGLEKHIDFADIDYKDDNFISPKGDKFLRAVTANKTFNPGTTTYIEDFYDYDTQSAQELLNRTLTQLKERSEPQYTYDADVKVIDPTLDIGDTVTIIDHDYNPALYLQARVATLDKSYTDPTQGSITFCNYRVLNSTLSDQLRAMQNIIDKLPTSASVKLINSNIVTLITQNEDLKKQVTLALKSADGKNVNYYGPDQPIQPAVGDIWFKQNGDKQVMMIYRDGQWHELASDMTGEEIKAKVAEAFANDEALQKRVEDNDTKIADNITKTDAAVSTANQAVSAAGFNANQIATIKSDMATAISQASTAYDSANTALGNAATALSTAKTASDDAATAINAATDAQTKTNSLVTEVDDIAGTIKTLATTETVDQLAGTVATTQSLAQFAADGLKLKSDITTVDTLKGTVNDLKGELDVQADKIAATVTASDVTGMLGNYATQSWSQGQISAAKNEISASVQNMTSDMATQTWTQGKLDLTADGLKTQISSVKNDLTNLAIGGRNYFSVSGFAANKYTSPYNGEYIDYYDLQLLPNTKYTVSTTNVGIPAQGYANVFVGNKGFTPDSGGNGVIVNKPRTVTTDNTGVLTVAARDYSLADGKDKIQVELGAVATLWQPAPEDMATAVQFTSIEETLKGVQITANNAVTQSQYTQLADQFTSTITGVKNDLNNMQIGGRNYIKNSDRAITINGDTDHFKILYFNLEPGTWTFSANAKYTRGSDTAIAVKVYNAGHQTQISTTSPKIVNGRIKTTFNVTSDAAKELLIYASHGEYADTPGNTIEIDHYKLEQGNKSTDWSPAPEDQATVADVSSQITQLKDDINLRVKTGDFATAVLNINDTISARVTNDDFRGAMLSMSDKIDLQVYNAKNGNLLRNSEFITDKYWTSTGNHSFWPFEPKKSSINVPSVLIIAAGAGAKNGGQLTTEFKADGLKKYDKVTLSFYAQGAAGTQLTFTLNGTTLDTYAVTLTATRTYYTLTLVYDTGNKLSIFADRADNTIYVDSLMLAKGATAMPWEPAGDNILTRIYMDDSDVLIQGKHIHLDGETTIDDAIIKSAMIDTVSANKLTAGTIDANNINVIHINGQNITANSITADKLAANAIQVGLNNLGSVIQINPASLDFYKGGQRSMSLQKDGMHIIDYLNGEDVGLIHINRIDGHDNVNGLEFDLNKSGDYMAWGQRSDDTSLYDVKMGWFSSYGASQSNFARGVNIMDDLTIDSHYTAYLTKIGTNYDEHRYIQFSNTNVGNIPGVLIGSMSGHGILIGDDAIYLVFSGGVYNMWDVIHSIGTGRRW